MDRLSRRSWLASAVLHAVVVGLAFLPAWRPVTQRTPPPQTLPAPVPAQRLILVPQSQPAAQALPPLPVAALPGWAEHGVEREQAEVITPRSGGTQDQGGASQKQGDSPVALPPMPLSAVERATRFDDHVWSDRELSLEQQRLGDMGILLERLLRDAYRENWTDLKGPLTTPDLFLEITVDGHGRVVQARRINSMGSTALDDAIDHWLHDPDSPLSLPPIAPGVPHVVKVSLYEL